MTKFICRLVLLPALLLVNTALAGNTRVVIDTEAETLTVLRGDRVVKTFDDIAIGRYGKTYFKVQGDNKTPLGSYRIGWINRESRYYIFLGLNYPDQPAVDRALQDGRIDADQWRKFRRAHRSGKTPSQLTPLGGYIGIHGLGRGELELHQQYNWTNGCVALTNKQVDELLRWAGVGTAVEIR